MALKMDIEESDRFFTNADKIVNFEVLQSDEETPQDITGWALSWMLKRRITDPDASALITKTTGGGSVTIIGTYDAARASNSQRARVIVTDEDTVNVKAGFYVQELKRTDAGSETPLSAGRVYVQQSAHRL